MSVYCISDPHGHWDEFNELLQRINFQENDEMYILGDIIDRGPQGADWLWFATKEAPRNFHFLKGNHEDMLVTACKETSNNSSLSLGRFGSSWSYNYGFITIKQIQEYGKYYPEWESEIIEWAANLPYFYDINVRGRRFVLVHAGLQSMQGQWPQDMTQGGQEFPEIVIADAPPQNRQAMLWDRTKWITDKYEWPFDVVCGHTPTCSVQWEVMREYDFTVEQAGEGAIVHLNGRKHFIDCGVNRGYYLGCLRLDDMREFYVKGKQTDI